MSLKSRIQDDIKTAMRARERERLGCLRLITAAIKQKEVDERVELDDAAVLAVLDKMVKQRRESLEQYESAGRSDLAEQERWELELISTYLPEQLGADELNTLIGEAVESAGATSMRDMGAVMAKLRPQVQGRADMKAVSTAVREMLNR
ncbi:MAG: GatB/YqeY domain-containing protein [Lysobacterales bacterium]